MSILFEQHSSLEDVCKDTSELISILSNHFGRKITLVDLGRGSGSICLRDKAVVAKSASNEILGLLIYDIVVKSGIVTLRVKCSSFTKDYDIKSAMEIFYLIAETLFDEIETVNKVLIVDRKISKINEEVLRRNGYNCTLNGYEKELKSNHGEKFELLKA